MTFELIKLLTKNKVMVLWSVILPLAKGTNPKTFIGRKAMMIGTMGKVTLSIIVTGVLTFGTMPTRAEGACGAAASSCKSCHEVKGEMKVNEKGSYHKQHAFADFCVFCHGGDTAATTKEAAHKGMIKPLENLEKSCSACHPDDYKKRAKSYEEETKH